MGAVLYSCDSVLIGVIIPYWGTAKTLVIIPVGLGAISLLLVLLAQVNIGFILLLIACMFVPFSGPGGVNAAIAVIALLVVLWLIDIVVVKKHFQIIKSNVLLPIIVFFCVSFISFIMGQVPWLIFANQAPITAQLGGFFIFALSLGAMLVSGHLIQDVKWLQVIVWTFIILGTIYLMGRFFKISFVVNIYQYGALGSMFWTWLTALAFSQVIFNRKMHLRIKVFLALVSALIFYVAVAMGYDWKSGWVPPLVVVIIILGIRFKKVTLFIFPFIMIGAIYFIFALIASDDYSWGTRIDAWNIVLKISGISPLFGLGFSNYYWYTPLFPIRGYSVNFNSHSQYIDLIAQTGYLGLLSFLWIFFETGRLSWKLSQKLHDGFTRAYAYGCLAGTVATIVAAFLGDWVLPFVYNVGMTGFRASVLPWIFLGGLIFIEQISQRSMELQKS